MPSTALGQMITLAIQVDHDPAPAVGSYVTVSTQKGDTIQIIASRLGYPTNARAIGTLNNVRDLYKVINDNPPPSQYLPSVRIPARMRPAQVLSALCGAEAPKVTTGYAKFQNIDRFGRAGITQFMGYDPLQLTVQLLFEGLVADFATTQQIIDTDGDAFARAVNSNQQKLYAAQLQRAETLENQMRLLERMAGRDANGTGIGPPPVIKASTTDSQGNVVGLIPITYQSHGKHAGLLWRVAGLTWEDGAIRNERGNRLRAGATVVLQEHTHTSLASQSAAQRAKAT